MKCRLPDFPLSLLCWFIQLSTRNVHYITYRKRFSDFCLPKSARKSGMKKSQLALWKRARPANRNHFLFCSLHTTTHTHTDIHIPFNQHISIQYSPPFIEKYVYTNHIVMLLWWFRWWLWIGFHCITVAAVVVHRIVCFLQISPFFGKKETRRVLFI